MKFKHPNEINIKIWLKPMETYGIEGKEYIKNCSLDLDNLESGELELLLSSAERIIFRGDMYQKKSLSDKGDCARLDEEGKPYRMISYMRTNHKL